jgi:hypothetical protein
MVADDRSVRGVGIDLTGRHTPEAYHSDGATVAVVDDEASGEVQAEDVPVPDGGEPPETAGQTTLDEWGRSA